MLLMFSTLMCHAQIGRFLEEQREREAKLDKICVNPIISREYALEHLANGEYEEAFDIYQFITKKFDDGLSYLYCGIMSELGIGTIKDYDGAEMFYEDGADFGESQACKESLERIQRKQYLTEKDKRNFLDYNKKIYLMGHSSTNSVSSDMGIGSGVFSGTGSSSGSTYRTCPSCGGSGTCSSCHGSGGEWRDTGYYTGSGAKSWISCPSCSGSKRCFNCHGSGKI